MMPMPAQLQKDFDTLTVQRAQFIAFASRHVGADAEDAVQNAYVKAWRALVTGRGRLDGRCTMRTWFYTIVMNECKQLRRGNGRRLEQLEHDTRAWLPRFDAELDAHAQLGRLLTEVKPSTADQLRLLLDAGGDYDIGHRGAHARQKSLTRVQRLQRMRAVRKAREVQKAFNQRAKLKSLAVGTGV